MDSVKETAAAQPHAPIWPDVLCSIGAGMNAISGFGRLVLAHGWRNEALAGGLQAIGAVALVPPVLQLIRDRFPQAKPRWVPVLYAFALMPMASLISLPLSPSPAEIVQLRAAAVKDARALLANGQVDEAGVALNRYQSDHDAAVDLLIRQIAAKKAATASVPLPTNTAVPELHEQMQSPGSAYAERVQTYWLPAVHALPDAAPEDEDAYKNLIVQLDGLLQDVADGAELELTPDEQAARHELVRALAKKQVVLFPSIRRRFGKVLRAKLFRDDIDASVSGPGGTTLTQVGPMFINNANIEDDQQASLPMMTRARFRREEYRWGHSLGGTYTYTYHPPSDDAVMLWNDSMNEWTPIK